MKYEEIKVGDVFRYQDYVETVVCTNDKHRFIITIDSKAMPTMWRENELHLLEPLPKELPEEGLLVSEGGSLVYRLPDGSGYGFEGILQSGYYFNKLWDFSQTDYWKPATPEQEKKFIEMLKKECEKHGLFEDTKIENHADRISPCPNSYGFMPAGDITQIWNKNGQIFYKGNFATPLKESTLDQVTDAVKGIADFTIEESPTGLIILTPIK